MGCGGVNTGISPCARPDTSTGGTYQLLLGSLQLLYPLGLPTQADTPPEVPYMIPAKVINLACTDGFLRDVPNDIINEQCQFCKINGKLYSSFTKDTAFADSGSSYMMDPS